MEDNDTAYVKTKLLEVYSIHLPLKAQQHLPPRNLSYRPLDTHNKTKQGKAL